MGRQGAGGRAHSSSYSASPPFDRLSGTVGRPKVPWQEGEHLLPLLSPRRIRGLKTIIKALNYLHSSHSPSLALTQLLKPS